MTSPGGQASYAKMMPPQESQQHLACHSTKKVKSAEQRTYLSKIIGTVV
jgi:hypothetical protein